MALLLTIITTRSRTRTSTDRAELQKFNCKKGAMTWLPFTFRITSALAVSALEWGSALFPGPEQSQSTELALALALV
jgi:hypothetical protein